jgi:hypothetical protein
LRKFRRGYYGQQIFLSSPVPGQSELPGLVVAAALAPGHAERACVQSIDVMRLASARL